MLVKVAEAFFGGVCPWNTEDFGKKLAYRQSKKKVSKTSRTISI